MIEKFFSRLFEKTSGFGYKPIRLIVTSIIIIILSTVLMYLTDNTQSTSTFLNCFLILIKSFIGQSNIENPPITLEIITNIKYTFGIIIFVMLVNSLYLRYKK